MIDAVDQVVIVGGGFAGLACARALRSAPVQVTLIDRTNHYLFQPLLYQVATGTLSAGSIAAPLRQLVRQQRNCQVLMATATGIDVLQRELILDHGRIGYTQLVLAMGSRHSYFGHPEWAAYAPGLKTIEDAIAMRQRLFSAFEAAELEHDAQRRQEWLTFVVVGGGTTGVELVGAVAEIAYHSLRGEFRTSDPHRSRIVLLEAGERLLPGFDPHLSASARRDLVALGVEVITSARVVDVTAMGVAYVLDQRIEHIAARTVLWGAGVEATPVARDIAATLGAETDKAGRLVVAPDCSLMAYPDIYAIGDLASYTPRTEGGSSAATAHPLPGVAQVAMQQGAYVGRSIAAHHAGRARPPFRYRDYGTLASIGRGRAVGIIHRLRLTGLVAWLIWVVVHLRQLASFERKTMVFLQWAWSYTTWSLGNRLITDVQPRVRSRQPSPSADPGVSMPPPGPTSSPVAGRSSERPPSRTMSVHEPEAPPPHPGR